MFELTKDSAEIPSTVASHFQRPSKKQQANVRTTRPKIKLEGKVPSDDDFADIVPTNIDNSNVIEDSHSANNVFCCAVLGDATTGTFYTDMTGAFPVTSLESMQAYFVAYDYNTTTFLLSRA